MINTLLILAALVLEIIGVTQDTCDGEVKYLYGALICLWIAVILKRD
jgi:hypothetical protein